MLKNETNYIQTAEIGIEFSFINGKTINNENDDKYLLLKKTSHNDRFVVYDSGFFEKGDEEKLLRRYVLKDKAAENLSQIIYDTFSLMRKWLPTSIILQKNESRFRVIKNFFSLSTYSTTKGKIIYDADIVDNVK